MKALTLEDLDRKIQQVRRRVRRFIETRDLKRLARLKGRLTKLQVILGFSGRSMLPGRAQGSESHMLLRLVRGTA
jgi:hypothetical protein